MPDTPQSVNRHIQHRRLSIPSFIYGTAWKEELTEPLTRLAIVSGFRGIDTANQRRHYHEAGVGIAIRSVLNEGALKRSDLFLQSKFTYAAGQDHRLPYDPDADYTTQVWQSFESSLTHLGTTYLDSYILHGPSTGRGLTNADWEVWRAMENLHTSGTVKLIGISNFNADQLRLLLEKVDVKPAFVQNRCFARNQWDAEIRNLCQRNDIIYQGFSLLTANAAELDRMEIRQITDRVGCSLPQLVFRFALQVGMIPLTGTTNHGHMKEDLSVYDWELSAADVTAVETIVI